MPEREIPSPAYDRATQVKIINVATKLFGLKGFDAVTLRDIAKEVGIKLSSIQHYYKKKADLWQEVLSCFEKGYRHYFAWLAEENKNVNTLEGLMGNFFNKEFVEMLDPMGCFGMAMLTKSQHANESARKRFFDLFYDLSVKNLQTDMDRLIEKGVLPPSDTKEIALILMLGVIIINDIHVHEYIGANPPLDCLKVCNRLKKIIFDALSAPMDDT